MIVSVVSNQARFVSALEYRELKLRRPPFGLQPIPTGLALIENLNPPLYAAKPQINPMKHRFAWASAVALAITVISPIETRAAYTNSDGLIISNGVVFVTTRSASDGWFRTQSSSTVWDTDDPRGPGGYSPGDVKMCEMLQDYGYATRLMPEKSLSLLTFGGGGPTLYWDSATPTDPYYFYYGGGLPGGNGISGGGTPPNVLYSAVLIIVSGSGGSADMPVVNTNNIPIIMGEHSCLGANRANAANERSEIYLYANKTSSNNTSTNSANLYMKVVNPNHPIMQGIPLDAQGRVKMYRDPYPEELAHGPRAEGVAAGKLNYEVGWTVVNTSSSIPAPGLDIIGRLDSDQNQVVFAVMEAGGTLAATVEDSGHPWFGRSTAPSRLVQLFVNEGGNGNSRRAFNCLSDLGKVIFIRTCKWAMGETLAPYQSLGLIRVSQLGGGQIKLAWDGTADKNYKILGTQNLLGPANYSNWQTVAQDIRGSNGNVSATLDISGGPQYAFLRVMPDP